VEGGPSAACDPADPAAVRHALIGYLLSRLGEPALDFADPPARILGGDHTWVHGFRLTGPVAPPWRAPLILRILRPTLDPESVRAETVLHGVLADQGYPVPEVLDFELAPARLGGPFQIMTRVPGAPLLHGFDDPDERGGEGLFSQQLRAGLGKMLFSPWPRLLAETHARLHELDTSDLPARLRGAGSDPTWFDLERRLATLRERIDHHALDGLRPVADWLRGQRPGPDVALRVCHGDLFANQVLAERGRVSGVIDWSRATLAPAELDVGVVAVGMDCVALEIPVPLAQLAEGAHRLIASGFRRAYRRRRRVDPRWFRYGGAFRCAEMLVEVSILRLVRSGRVEGSPGPNPYDSRRGVRLLARYLRRAVGVAVSVPEPGA
jgi:aminoglycoside phosphotransferase (APT) family kinase protein